MVCHAGSDGGYDLDDESLVESGEPGWLNDDSISPVCARDLELIKAMIPQRCHVCVDVRNE